jgi:Ras GTPase-activating-like protein IQGAP2/3
LVRWTAISNFYFLRFVAPALVSPKASGVYDGNPSPQALRALMLISKTLSNAANGVPFGDKVRLLNRGSAQNNARTHVQRR